MGDKSLALVTISLALVIRVTQHRAAHAWKRNLGIYYSIIDKQVHMK
jgi:hypothetical protein